MFTGNTTWLYRERDSVFYMDRVKKYWLCLLEIQHGYIGRETVFFTWIG